MTETLRLVVFDLDYTIWDPEMYLLYGGPRLTPVDSPANRGLAEEILEQARTIKDGYILTDESNSPMRIFPGASYALNEIEKMKKIGYDIQAAAASKTDEPEWADICLRHLIINPEKTILNSCFQDGHLVEIDVRSKTNHFKRLHHKTGIPYEQMAFFDNEYGNIRTVSSLGVKCYYTPDGMMKEHWDQAKADFDIDVDVCKTNLN